MSHCIVSSYCQRNISFIFIIPVVVVVYIMLMLADYDGRRFRRVYDTVSDFFDDLRILLLFPFFVGGFPVRRDVNVVERQRTEIIPKERLEEYVTVIHTRINDQGTRLSSAVSCALLVSL